MSRWFDILKVIAPVVIGAVVPGGQVIAPVVAHAMDEAEQIQGASGAAKKDHVMAIGRDAITAINAAAKKPLVPAGALDALDEGIDTAIAVTNTVAAVKASPAQAQ